MIRDEVSKIIDVRIPPNGYRRYIKEIARTGGFQQRQHEDSLIVIFQAIEELEKKVVELEQRLQVKEDTFSGGLAAYVPEEEIKVIVHPQVGEGEEIKVSVKEDKEQFTCEKCGMSFDSRIALQGHSRKKDHQDAITNTTKSDPTQPVQS